MSFTDQDNQVHYAFAGNVVWPPFKMATIYRKIAIQTWYLDTEINMDMMIRRYASSAEDLSASFYETYLHYNNIFWVYTRVYHSNHETSMQTIITKLVATTHASSHYLTRSDLLSVKLHVWILIEILSKF